MIVCARYEIVEPYVIPARRVLAEPTVMLARREFVEPKVRARCVLGMCFGHITLGICLKC